MYSYTISKEADIHVFRKMCNLLENELKGIEKKRIVEDIDGSIIQHYCVNDSEIRVYNDCDVDAVFVDSQINLDSVIKNPILSYQNPEE